MTTKLEGDCAEESSSIIDKYLKGDGEEIVNDSDGVTQTDDDCVDKNNVEESLKYTKQELYLDDL